LLIRARTLPWRDAMPLAKSAYVARAFTLLLCLGLLALWR
jgi:hypothetical protein